MRNNNTIPLNLPFSHFLSAISNSRYIRGILRFLTELKIAGLNCNLGLFLRGIQFLESKRFLLYLVYIFCAILRLPQMLSTDLIMTLRFHCLRLTAFLKLLQDVSCMVWLFNVTRMWLISFSYFTSSRRQKNTTSPNHVRIKLELYITWLVNKKLRLFPVKLSNQCDVLVRITESLLGNLFLFMS